MHVDGRAVLRILGIGCTKTLQPDNCNAEGLFTWTTSFAWHLFHMDRPHWCPSHDVGLADQTAVCHTQHIQEHLSASSMGLGIQATPSAKGPCLLLLRSSDEKQPQ